MSTEEDDGIMDALMDYVGEHYCIESADSDKLDNTMDACCGHAARQIRRHLIKAAKAMLETLEAPADGPQYGLIGVDNACAQFVREYKLLLDITTPEKL